MKGIGKYKLLGETRDDAAGECLDKVARILGLEYPGGPAIAAETAKLPITNYKLPINLPRPMINQENYDFSFSGLKTAALYHYKSQFPKVRQSRKYIQEMAREIQQAIIDVLISKTIRAAKEYKAKSIMIGGGVSANKELRKQIKKTIKEKLPLSTLYIPPSKFCTDNAAMVGVAGYFGWLSGKQKSAVKIKANANLTL
jgi:N6-L-threonylcarbamoyladenine synthase